MKEPLSAIASRARRWRFEAGTTEMAAGGIFISVGLALLVPPTPSWVPTVFIPGILLTGAVVEGLQRRCVYPRIGYLEFRENTGRGFGRLLLMVFVSLAALGGSLALIHAYRPEAAPAWMTPLLAGYVGAVMAAYAAAMKVRRLFLLGLLSAALGLVLSPLALGLERPEWPWGLGALTSYLMAMGFLFVFSGACAFRSFLRRNPPPVEAADGQ
jgi:hypothetical protein